MQELLATLASEIRARLLGDANGALILSTLVFALVFIYLTTRGDDSRAFLLLYAGVAYLLAISWTGAQLFTTLRRLSPPPDFLSGLRSKINVTFSSAPHVQFLDNDALDRAQQHLNRGGSLEEACALAEPRYRLMDGHMRQLFRQTIEAVLAQRRNK